MIKVLCCHPNCNEWAVSGHRLCPKHLEESNNKRQEYQKKLFKNVKRLNQNMYATYNWHKLRNKIIQEHPYCTYCGCLASKNNPLTVDHIICPRGNQELFFDSNNLQVLCRLCHNKKTRQEIVQRQEQK